MQATIEIDAQLLHEAEAAARRKGQGLSVLVEQALRDSLRTSQEAVPIELYGEPLTEEDIAESARVAFSLLDAEEKSA